MQTGKQWSSVYAVKQAESDEGCVMGCVLCHATTSSDEMLMEAKRGGWYEWTKMQAALMSDKDEPASLDEHRTLRKEDGVGTKRNETRRDETKEA